MVLREKSAASPFPRGERTPVRIDRSGNSLLSGCRHDPPDPQHRSRDARVPRPARCHHELRLLSKAFLEVLPPSPVSAPTTSQTAAPAASAIQVNRLVAQSMFANRSPGGAPRLWDSESVDFHR